MPILPNRAVLQVLLCRAFSDRSDKWNARARIARMTRRAVA
jgi:hypothetical protein